VARYNNEVPGSWVEESTSGAICGAGDKCVKNRLKFTRAGSIPIGRRAPLATLAGMFSLSRNSRYDRHTGCRVQFINRV
jgi:hypothetical protein